MSDTFQNRLLKGLSARNMTPAELARKTGFSKARISQYVNGVYKGKQQAVYLIAKALNVSESWLMGYDTEMTRKVHEKCADEVKVLEQVQDVYGKKAVQIISDFNQLNETGKDKAIENIADLTAISKYTEKEKSKIKDA